MRRVPLAQILHRYLDRQTKTLKAQIPTQATGRSPEMSELAQTSFDSDEIEALQKPS